MPYKTTSELPANVREALPSHAQSIFLAAFNSAVEQGKDEETAFKIAWGAIKKSYEKVDGKWQKINNMVFFANAEFVNKEHDVILQRLNQKLHYKDYGDIFYPVQLFQEMGNQWDNIPIIYAKDHPDFDLFITNPILALQQVNGSIVGKITNPKVELTGTSRFVAKFQIDNPVIENLIKDGKLAHSTGFKGTTDANNTLTSMIPNHVLVFTEGNPRDAGAIILNKKEIDIEMANKEPTKEEMDAVLKTTVLKNMLKELQSHPEMMDDEMKTMMKDMKNKEQETIDTMGKEDELSKQLEISNKEKETLTETIEGFKKEIANKDEQLKVFVQKETDRLKTESDARWQEIKNKLPVGLTHKDEDVVALRRDWESNKDAFYMKHFVNAEHTMLPGEEGKSIANQELDAKAKQGFTVGGTYTVGD